MYRFLFKPKWIAFHLLVVVAIVTMVDLGFWQLRRLEQKREFNATVEERYDAPPLPFDDLLTPGTDPGDVEWRPVTVSGTYLPDGTITLVNRSQGGRSGQDLVVPLRLDDGRVLLVNRGFIPQTDGVGPPVPAERVNLVARLRTTQERRTGQLSDPPDGPLLVAQRVDVQRLADQVGGNVVPMYVDLVRSDPPEVDRMPEPVIAPVLGEANHLSYAVQWYIFSTAVAVGWVLAVRRSIGTHRHEVLAAASGPPEPDPVADPPTGTHVMVDHTVESTVDVG